MKLLVLITAILVSAAVHAEDDWVYVTDSNTSDIYLNAETVEPNLDSYYVDSWQKYVDKKNLSYIVTKDRYYCKSKKIQSLELHSYSSDGSYIEGNRKAASIVSAIPDTVGVELLELACVSGAYTELLNIHYGLIPSHISAETQYNKIMNNFGLYATTALENYLDSFKGLD